MAGFVSYEKPPVGEVAFGLQFMPIKGFRTAHVGLYWQSIRDRYPDLEEKRPVPHVQRAGAEQSFLDAIADRMPGPRTWFVGSDSSRLIQLQLDRFVYNWRKTSLADVYPRYEPLSHAFLAEWEAFVGLLERESISPPQPDLYELTYLNLIPQGDGWESVADIPRLLRFVDPIQVNPCLQDPDHMDLRMQFPLQDNSGHLVLECSLGHWQLADRKTLRISMTARGLPESGYSLESLADWFDLGHEAIVKGFADLTSDTAAQLWGRTE